jgi:hypothetical protein
MAESPVHHPVQVPEPIIKIEEAPEEVGGSKTSEERNKQYLLELPYKIKKVYQIGDYEGVITFTGIVVHLTTVDEESKTFELKLPMAQLNQIYRADPERMANIILDSIYHSNGEPLIKIDPNLDITDNLNQDNYPEKKNFYETIVSGKTYDVEIR